LDYELEVGIVIGGGNTLGQAVPIENAEQHLFGLCLLNDWSARDIQAWEYQPLGPFLSKSFATTISPWIVTTEALVPFRCRYNRVASDPQPLAYLRSGKNSQTGGFNIKMDVLIQTEQSEFPMQLSQTNFKHAYWTVAQMISHHTANGCNLKPGDLFGSGTQSGPKPSEAGSLLELSEGGKKPLPLANGETRTFLEDGDTIIFRAWCESSKNKRIGFGECCGTVLPAFV
jgi:fumarylacetoacetase